MKKLKTRIVGGISILFLLIVLLSLAGSLFVFELSRDSRAILRDNNASVNYAHIMLNSLDVIQTMQIKRIMFMNRDSLALNNFTTEYAQAITTFNNALMAQEKNITEVGEKELVEKLGKNYQSYLDNFSLIIQQNVYNPSHYYSEIQVKYNQVRNVVEEIYNLNMNAILQRNTKAENTADHVGTYISILGLFCIIFTVWLLIYLPKMILKPISELTAKIREISQRNYDQRLDYPPGNELGEMALAFNTMAVKLREFESQNLEQILLEKKRLESIIENFDDAVLVLGKDNTILYINHVTLKLLGLEKSQVIGKSVSSISWGNNQLQELINEILLENKSKPSQDEIIEWEHDNQKRFYHVQIIKMRSFASPSEVSITLGHLILLKNITRFEERDVARTSFMATVSHELKTPISAINLNLKLLKDHRVGALNSEQENLTDSISLQTARLLRIVNELLEYSRIQMGNIHLEIVKVEPFIILSFAIDALAIFIKEKQVSIKKEIEPDLPLVWADIEKTVWVLVNLLGNAIRYTPVNGTILLKVSKEGNFVVFTVKDEGPGIKAEDQRKLFQKFVQLGEKGEKGSGLGLALSKEFIESQGGFIGLTSESGQGSTFYFQIPTCGSGASIN